MYAVFCRFEYMEEKKVFVNKEDCTSCNACAENLPKYFRMDEDDLAESHNEDGNVNDALVSEEDETEVQSEIDECPGECIHWKVEGFK